MTRRSEVPDFWTQGKCWECWVVGGDYVWRSGSLSAGRIPGTGEHWAVSHGKRLTGTYNTLETAMIAAIQAAAKRRAA
jgi:hypothetical protein